MTSLLDQENLIAGQQTIAANKPLNQNIRALQPKTPGNNLKTPFRIQNDENNLVRTGKPAKNTFATPGPAPKTAPRAVLGAKTANAKGQAFQTPAPPQKTQKLEKTAKKASSTRRTNKKKIYIEPEQPVESRTQDLEEENEPDFGYAPPPITPLPDLPIEFDYDQTYTALRPENFNRGVAEIYFQSPKDENGFSLSLKKLEEADRKSLQRDLDNILEEAEIFDTEAANHGEEQAQNVPTSSRPSSRSIKQSKAAGPKIQEPNISTLRSRNAADALTATHSTAAYSRTHARLPSVVTAQTTASKQKRKSTFAVVHDPNTTALPSSRTTIGFPKAKKPPSILPWTQNLPSQPHSRNQSQVLAPSPDDVSDKDLAATVSPRKFVELHGEPAVESDLWVQLKELEIRNRRRQDQEDDDLGEPIFDFDEVDVVQSLAIDFGNPEDEETYEDFELTLD